MQINNKLFFYFFIIILVSSCNSNNGDVVVINKSNDEIKKIEIFISDQIIIFENILTNKVVSSSYKITKDSHFDINVDLTSGIHLEKKTGYITTGFDFKHEIIITDNEIKVLVLSLE